MRLTVLTVLLLCGCSTPPLTPEEESLRLIHEQERQEYYVLWKAACLQSGGVLFSYNSTGSKIRRSIPLDRDWDFYYIEDESLTNVHKVQWEAKRSNNLQCVRKEDLKLWN